MSLNKISVNKVSGGNNALKLDLTSSRYQKTAERHKDNFATMGEQSHRIKFKNSAKYRNTKIRFIEPLRECMAVVVECCSSISVFQLTPESEHGTL